MTAAGAAGDRGSARWTWLVAMVAGLSLVALTVVVLVQSLGGEEVDDAVAAGEILLEPAHEHGPDPFAPDLAAPDAAPPLPLPTAAVTSESAAGAATVTGLDPTRPGLYGGTRDNASCDADQLIAFLAEHPAHAEAWAGVAGIQAEEIPQHVRTLTSVSLRADTRVTNHGYRDGRATPRQSVLETGTAVMVDDLGIPRVRCACGNPLLPPEAVTVAVRYVGTPWPTFSVTTIVNVVNVQNTVIEEFVLVDGSTADVFTRRPGSPATGPADDLILIDHVCDLYPDLCIPPGLPPVPDPPATASREGEPDLETGQVQISLRWSSTADLDLAVTDPLGDTVSFSNRSVASGGALDVDANSACSGPTSTPVENVVWPVDAPDGTYRIAVSYFTDCTGGAGPQPFELIAVVEGQPVPLDVITGAVDRSADPNGELLQVMSRSSGPTGGSWALPVLGPSATGTLSAPGDTATYRLVKEPIPSTARVPGPVRGLTAAPTANSREVEIAWQAPEVVGPGIDRYIIRLDGVETQTGAAQTSITLPFVEPGRTYTVTVQAVNGNGYGPTQSTDLTIPAEQPAERPQPTPTQDGIDEFCDDCLRAWRESGGAVMYDAFCGLMCMDAEEAG